jgi:hypothetical protein
MMKVTRNNGIITVNYTFTVRQIDEMTFYAYLWYDGDYSKVVDDFAFEDYDEGWYKAAVAAMKAYDTGAMHEAIIEAVEGQKAIAAARKKEWERLAELAEEMTGD